jgi:LacI family transcriptional regulator
MAMKSTIYDVANRANVAISTVSRVLNNSGYVSEKTKQKVLKAIEELHFQQNMVATALMKKQTHTFGLIIPDIKNAFYSDLTRAVEDVANQHGYNVILCNTDHNLHKEADYVNFLLQKGIDGIIFSTPVVRDNNVRNVIESRPDLPVVVIGSRVEGVQIDEILVDNYEGGYEVTHYLLEQGHRRIGFISGSGGTYATIERLKGFKTAFEELGIKPDSDIILLGDFSIESGYENAKKLLQKKERPTAIFAGNDSIAVGVYRAARELQLKIPDDLSVVGFDDSLYAQILTPMLTTVHTPIQEMGARAMTFAINTLKGEKTSKETVVFRPTLLIRESVLPCYSQVGKGGENL